MGEVGLGIRRTPVGWGLILAEGVVRLLAERVPLRLQV